MTTKEYLSQAMRYKRRYEMAMSEVEYVRSMADGVKAIRYDKDQVQSSPKNDQMVEYMIRLERAEDRAFNASEKYFEAYVTIQTQITMISPQLYSDVLWSRYIQGQRLWQIADEMNYSYGYIKHIHGLALLEFGKVFREAIHENGRATRS